MANDKQEAWEQKYRRLAAAVGTPYDADVLIYSGEIEDTAADELIGLAKKKTRRKNVVLLLASRGGSPDAAFRMARVLKRYYAKFILFIYGMCKSAGTLVAVGADEIILSDFGEFGPLDVQLGKKDELLESMSGLNITQALASLNTRTLDFFNDALIELRTTSKGQISTKLASEIASNLAVGSYKEIYSQIDPIQLGAIERAINIASDYGKRLASKNVRPTTIDRLVNRYSSHNFVIDLEEAKELFHIVRVPNEVEEELCETISFVLRDQAEKPFATILNEFKQEQNHDQTTDNQQPDQGSKGAQEGSQANNSTAPKARTPARTKPVAVVGGAGGET